MLVSVLAELGGFSQLWERLGRPALEGHTKPAGRPVLMVFLIAYLFIKTFEYNGGMWNQAQR